MNGYRASEKLSGDERLHTASTKKNRIIKIDEDGDFDQIPGLRPDLASTQQQAGVPSRIEKENNHLCGVRKRLRQVLLDPAMNFDVEARRVTCGSEDLGCDCAWANKRLCNVKNNDASLCFATCCCEVQCDTQLKEIIEATKPWCENLEEMDDDTSELRLRPTIHDIATQKLEKTASMSHGCGCDWVQEDNCDPALNDGTPCYAACCNMFHAQKHILHIEQFLSEVVMPSGVLLDVKSAPNARAMASTIASVKIASANPALSVGVGRGRTSDLFAFPSTDLLPPWEDNRESTRAEYLFRDIGDMGPRSFGAKTSQRPIKELLCRKGTMPQLCPVTQESRASLTKILKCISCALSWYTIMVSNGLHSWHHVLMHRRDLDGKLELLESVSSNVVQRKINPKSMVHGKNGKVLTKQLIDIGVPWACDMRKLVGFLKDGLPDRIAAMTPDVVDIRFIITNFGQCKGDFSPTHRGIHDAIRLHAGHKLDHFKIVDRPDEQFQRAIACNILHDVARDHSVLLVIDVDMRLSPPYFARSLAFAVKGLSVYFPVVWSRFNPASVRKVARLRGEDVEQLDVVGSPHSGKWRVWGKGNYAIFGSDAKTLRMDDRIVGWGGEDDDFFSRAQRVLNVVRMREPSLVHNWHPKDCTHSKGKKKVSCMGSLAEYEGSSLALVHHKMDEERKKTKLREQDRFDSKELTYRPESAPD